MLDTLSSPSVCVIDDEEADYKAILSVLNDCFISAIHLKGEVDSLPPAPFRNLQLVFLDLHLTAAIGKDAASYTANFFHKTVSETTPPLVVIIWSKYADDVPSGDDVTEAELFKQTLLKAFPAYAGRLIFVEMAKPKSHERSENWHKMLRAEMERALKGYPAIEVLWLWGQCVKEGCTSVSQDITSMAQDAILDPKISLHDGLKATMQKLAKAQSEGDLVPETAPRYLLSVLSQQLLDQLEDPKGIECVSAHGEWLSTPPSISLPEKFAGKINAFLFTSEYSSGGAAYAPGTVYRITDESGFQAMFGKNIDDLLKEWVKPESLTWKEWRTNAQPILIELSPVCDLAQGHRVNSLLVGGVVVPSGQQSKCKKSGDAYGRLPSPFYLRWPRGDFPAQEIFLSYCNRYKGTLPAGRLVEWLEPWFRLRELPLAAIRNTNAAHASRVGFVSVE